MKLYSFFFCLVLFSPLCAQPQSVPELELVESTPLDAHLANIDIPQAHDVWVEMIGRAQHSLDIEQFYIADQTGEPLQDILAGLCAAAKRGVHIRILVDAKMYKTYPVSVDTLGRYHNIETRCIDFGKIAGGIQHAKYFLVDGTEAYIGSQNFDWRSLKHIHELGVHIRSAQLTALYEDVFSFDWDLASGSAQTPVPHSTFSHAPVFPIHLSVHNGECAAIIPTFSPRGYIPDSSLWDETVLVHMIDHAQHSLILQFLTYSPLERHGDRYTVIDDALRRAALRGVKVQLIVADWEKSSPAVRSLKELSAVPNIEVAFTAIPDWSGGYISFARVEHCKFVVADSTSFWLGTSNCEKNYFYNSRNLGIAGTSSFIALQLSNIFLKSWNSPYKEFVTPNGTYFPRNHGENK